MITARPLVAADLPAALELLHAYDRRWFGEEVLTAADVAAEWSEPGFDLATDSEGWVEGRALVAFGTLGTRGALELAVDPAWSAAGLADALLDRWENEAGRRGLATLHRHLPAADEPSRALLEGRGWRVVRVGWLLRLAPETPVAAGGLPTGYAIRPMVEADVPAVFAVVRDAFATWSVNPRSYADWRAGVVDRPDMTLDHARVAVHDGSVVGVCLVLDPPPGPVEPGAGGSEAFVPQLAVHAAHRRQGLARELLAATTIAARERGVPALALYTHADTGALGLYQRFGMTIRHDLAEYELALSERAS